MKKAIFLSYTGVVLPRKGNEYREFLDTLAHASNLKDVERAYLWFSQKLREYKKNSSDDMYLDEKELLSKLFEDAKDEIKLSYPVEKLVIYCQNCLMYGPVSDEIPNFLSLVRKPVYLVSDCATDYAMIEMKRNHLHVHGIVSCEGAKCYRNHVEAFAHFLKTTGYQKDEVVYIGEDPEYDMLGAEEAGISAVLLDRRGDYHSAECKRTRSLASLLVNLGE